MSDVMRRQDSLDRLNNRSRKLQWCAIRNPRCHDASSSGNSVIDDKAHSTHEGLLAVKLDDTEPPDGSYTPHLIDQQVTTARIDLDRQATRPVKEPTVLQVSVRQSEKLCLFIRPLTFIISLLRRGKSVLRGVPSRSICKHSCAERDKPNRQSRITTETQALGRENVKLAPPGVTTSGNDRCGREHRFVSSFRGGVINQPLAGTNSIKPLVEHNVKIH